MGMKRFQVVLPVKLFNALSNEATEYSKATGKRVSIARVLRTHAELSIESCRAHKKSRKKFLDRILAEA